MSKFKPTMVREDLVGTRLRVVEISDGKMVLAQEGADEDTFYHVEAVALEDGPELEFYRVVHQLQRLG
jgi:hypothetical protein